MHTCFSRDLYLVCLTRLILYVFQSSMRTHADVRTCMRARTHTHTHIHTLTLTHTHTHTHTHSQTLTHIHTHKHTHTHTHSQTHTHTAAPPPPVPAPASRIPRRVSRLKFCALRVLLLSPDDLLLCLATSEPSCLALCSHGPMHWAHMCF